MSKWLNKAREWARDYEPATAKALVTAVLQVLIVAGIGLGDWPKVIDAILAAVGVFATVFAGRSIRKSVYSPATHDSEALQARVGGYRQALRDTR